MRLGHHLNFGARLGSWYPSLTLLHGTGSSLNHKLNLWSNTPLDWLHLSPSHPQEPAILAAGCSYYNLAFCQHQWSRRKSKLPREVADRSSLPAGPSSNSLVGAQGPLWSGSWMPLWHQLHQHILSFCISPMSCHFLIVKMPCPFRHLCLSTCSSLFLGNSAFSLDKNTTHFTSHILDTAFSSMPSLTLLVRPWQSLFCASTVSTHICLIQHHIRLLFYSLYVSFPRLLSPHPRLQALGEQWLCCIYQLYP